MAHGLEVWDASGTKKLSTADRLTKLHSVYSMTATGGGFTETFVSVSGMADDGTWAVQGDGYYSVARVSSGGFYYVLPLNMGSRTYKFLILRV